MKLISSCWPLHYSSYKQLFSHQTLKLLRQQYRNFDAGRLSWVCFDMIMFWFCSCLHPCPVFSLLPHCVHQFFVQPLNNLGIYSLVSFLLEPKSCWLFFLDCKPFFRHVLFRFSNAFLLSWIILFDGVRFLVRKQTQMQNLFIYNQAKL